MEPSRESAELAQFLVCVIEDLMSQEVKAIKGLDNCIQLRCVQAQDIAEFMKFRQSNEPTQENLTAF